jgi:CII-binding regulator of phage lambda lysogenization HflD
MYYKIQPKRKAEMYGSRKSSLIYGIKIIAKKHNKKCVPNVRPQIKYS